MSPALAAGFFPVSILQPDDFARVSTPAIHYFSTYIITTHQHQELVQCAVPALSE